MIIDQLEAVDDELDEIGILLVSTPDEEVAQEHGQDTFHFWCEVWWSLVSMENEDYLEL